MLSSSAARHMAVCVRVKCIFFTTIEWEGVQALEEFARLYKKLDKQCSYYCRHLGHLKGLIENDDWMRVVDGSTSGRVLLLGNSEITNALILFNTRMFDDGPDTITIHKLSSKLPTNEEIENHHRSRMQQLGFFYESGNV
jgi:hypothetical protein